MSARRIIVVGAMLALGACADDVPKRDAPTQRAEQAIALYALSAVAPDDAAKVGQCAVDNTTTEELVYLSGVDDPTRMEPAEIIEAVLTRTRARACLDANGVVWR